MLPIKLPIAITKAEYLDALSMHKYELCFKIMYS